MTIQNAETALAKLCRRKYVLMTGNATTSLYLSLKSLDLPFKSKVMIPNSSCPHVPLSVYLAGHEPFFIDIDKRNFGLDLDCVKKFYTKNIKAIIAVHAYGKLCQIKKIFNFCKKKNIPLIEDSALSLGLETNKKTSVSSALVSVLSFGKGKVLDLGGGGALLTDNKSLYLKAQILIKNLNDKKKLNSTIIKKTNKNHTQIYNKFFINNKSNLIKNLYKKQAIKNANYFLYKFENKYLKKLDLKKKNIKNIIQDRYKKIKYISKKLNLIKNNFFRLSKIEKNEVPWRFNIFFYKEKHRNQVLKILLKKRIKVSSWHPSLDIFFKNRKKGDFYPISDKLSKTILNIWINNEVNRSYLDTVCKNILTIKKQLI